jgi:uncharacterized protein YjbI with pentapeptide repeats
MPGTSRCWRKRAGNRIMTKHPRAFPRPARIMTTPEAYQLPLNKPVAVLDKPVRVDGRGIFRSLTKAVSHVASGKPFELIADAGEAASSLGLGKGPGDAAWELIRKSLIRALVDLSLEHRQFLRENEESLAESFGEHADLILDAEYVSIDQQFFRRPGDLPVLRKVEVLYRQLLVKQGFHEQIATNITNRIRSYFVFALIDEWRRNTQLYQSILTYLSTPFADAGEQEEAWIHYYAILEKQINEPLMGDIFTLEQIYVPLSACYEGSILPADFGFPLDDTEYSRRKIIVDVADYFDDWLNTADKRDALKIVSGGPGAGKSSFMKIFAARIAKQRRCRLLLIPLHKIDFRTSLSQAISDFIKNTGLQITNPLENSSPQERVLLLFDGLDELAMQGNLAVDAARKFIQEIDRTIHVKNHYFDEARYQAIVCGRELVVQHCASELRATGQVLNLLPYVILNQADYELADGLLLAQDKRHLWWQRYALATGKRYFGVPEVLQRVDLDEITAQPLLNYLVALSYERNRIDFTKQVTLNELYFDLLNAVYERGYEDRQHASVKGIDKPLFIRVLEEIALATWQGNGRTTTVSEIRKHCRISNLDSIITALKENADAGITRLLTAFYFRQFGFTSDGDQTFEFSHKSFGEYLTARRLVRGLRTMYSEVKRRREEHDGGWSELDALKQWLELCSRSEMDVYLLAFLKSEVKLYPVKEVREWQHLVAEIIGYMLLHGTPMEMLSPRPSYVEEARMARNAEESLLALLHSCSLVTGNVSRIPWPDQQQSPRAWLNRLRSHWTGSDAGIALKCLTLLDLRKANLSGLDLSEADLRGTDLSEANLAGADLTGADLSNSYLIGAKVVNIYMTGANLSGAVLNFKVPTSNYIGSNKDENSLDEDVIEQEVGFVDESTYVIHNESKEREEGNWAGENLQGANLRGADLSRANLSQANLSDADLSGACLERASFCAANLAGANLAGANLEGAYLAGANLRWSVMTNAMLDWANVEGVSGLQDADS